MTKTTKIIIGVIIAIIVIGGIWYWATREPKEEVIKIGFIGALTGDSAIVGEEDLRGIQLAVDKINSEGGIKGKKIELIARDDRMEEKETITEYRQLVDIQNINYIIVSTYGGFLTLAKQAETDGVVLIQALDASEELANLSKNAFAIGIYDESLAYAIADYLNNHNINEIGLISALEDPFVLLIKEAFQNRYNGKFQEENYTFSETDFRTILVRLSEYEYIFLLGWEETGRIVKQARELGMNTKFIGIDTFASKDFRESTNNNYEGLLFSFWQGAADNEKYNEMLSNYSSKFGKEPENVAFVAIGYDVMTILGETLKVCGNDVSCVVDTLRNNIKNFEGATGTITIDEDGISRSIKETIYIYRNGEIIEIKE